MKLSIFCAAVIFLGLPWKPVNGQIDFNEANAAIVAHEKGNQIRNAIDKKSFKINAIRDLSSSQFARNMTELQFIQAFLEKKDVISTKLEGQSYVKCLADVSRYYNDLLQVSSLPYALQMRSSFGRFDGLVSPSFTWKLEYLGVYELCDSVTRDHADVPFDTIYCTEHFPFDGGIYVKRGTCYPATCSNDELNVIFNSIFSELGLDALYGTYFTCVRDIPWTWDAIFVVCLLGFFAILILIGTIYDVTHRPPRALPTDKQINEKEEVEYQNDKTEALEMEEEGTRGTSDHHDGPMKHQSQQQLYMSPEEEADLEKEQGQAAAALGTNSRRDKVGFKDRLDVLLRSCSVVHNCGKILSAKTSSSSLSALNGIRVLSMFWVIWGHSNQFLLIQRLDNLKYVVDVIAPKFWYNSTQSGTYSVDSFFVLSGLLVTYLTLKELRARNGRLNWFMYYFHRFWRLTPTYMIVLGIWTSLAVHIGTGSDMEEYYAADSAFCTDYWWTNLLYINNLVPYNWVLGGCMGWSWYLANDMQFYVISPLFILLLFHRKSKNLGLTTIGFLCAASCIITATLTGYYGLPVGKTIQPYNNRTEALEPYGSSTDITYGKPWCRIQSYLVGAFVGYVLYKHMYFQKIKMYWVTNVVGWVLAIGIMIAMIFGLHGTSLTDPLPQWFAAVFAGTSRFLFSMGVGWVAFACSIGYGGYINSFLAWNFWTPLARLTYCAYLLHPAIIFQFLRTKKTTFHWTLPEITYFFLANVVASYVLALCLSVLVEGPTMGLERAVFRPRKRELVISADQKKTIK
ncbi:O-acyltransferase like protein-like [Apostichopus japonicus]|uniref:O-acyltransferase like protein-like n=1 Tax=Stichopus japonicus TaxID=307972 RepID=UPI003AB434A1